MEAYLLLGNTIRSDFPEQAVKIHQSLTVRPGLSKSVLVDIHIALAEDYRALKKNDYQIASEEMLDSKWAKQTPKRAEELSSVMKSCKIW